MVAAPAHRGAKGARSCTSPASRVRSSDDPRSSGGGPQARAMSNVGSTYVGMRGRCATEAEAQQAADAALPLVLRAFAATGVEP